MSLQYGQEKIEEVMRLMAGPENFPKRLRNAFSEIGVVTGDDASPKTFEKIVNWREKFLGSKLPELKEGEELSGDDLKNAKNLRNELVEICTEMIEENTTAQNNMDK